MTETTANLPAIASHSGSSLETKMQFARALATASLLPRAYQQNPGNVLIAMEFGDALGIPAIQAINSIHVIEGKPSASADLMAALVRKAGHKLRVKVTRNPLHVVAELIRADDPENPFVAEWDEDKARTANLLGKGNWKTYPDQMMRNRAITEVIRMGASDAMYGVIYTPEELGAEVNSAGDVVTVTQVNDRPAHRPGMTLREAAGQAPQNDGGAGSQVETAVAAGEAGSSPAGNTALPSQDIQDAEVVTETGTITDAQTKKLAVAMKAAGITDRQDALDYVMGVIGRDVTSRKQLSKDEASAVIDRLDLLIRTEAGMTDTGTGEVLDAEVVEDGGQS
ncbi:MAG TPA: hypothetical protein VGH54_09740 [Mycobacterium sp.]|jgi:hypothetical protein|uniref:hypothetical protein n=1 Tax=Mycobacterium sp. TaxID=1785 RepID=UPI002F4000AA